MRIFSPNKKHYSTVVQGEKTKVELHALLTVQFLERLKFRAIIAQIQIGLIRAKKTQVTMGIDFIGKTLKDAIHAWVFYIFLFFLSIANEAENE